MDTSSGADSVSDSKDFQVLGFSVEDVEEDKSDVLQVKKYKGVRYCSDKFRNRPWEASISINAKRISLGYFYKQQEAIDARKVAERLKEKGR